MKHITVDLEAKIIAQIQFCDERVKDGLASRIVDSADGIPTRPAEANELEAAGWRRALRWVLEEAGCK